MGELVCKKREEEGGVRGRVAKMRHGLIAAISCSTGDPLGSWMIHLE